MFSTPSLEDRGNSIVQWLRNGFYTNHTPLYVHSGTLKTISEDVEILPASKVFAVVHISKYKILAYWI